MVFSQLPVSEETRTKMTEVAETGGTLLFTTLPLLFMPSIFTTIGCVVVGLGKPMYSGIVAVLAVEKAAQKARRSLNKKDNRNKRSSVNRLLRHVPGGGDMGVAAAALHCTQWLEYWVVYTSFMFVHGLASVFLFWFPFWVQMQLLLILWLQLPYFRGSRRIFKTGLALHYRLRNMIFGESFFTGWFKSSIEEDPVAQNLGTSEIEMDDINGFEVRDDNQAVPVVNEQETTEDDLVEEDEANEADIEDDTEDDILVDDPVEVEDEPHAQEGDIQGEVLDAENEVEEVEETVVDSGNAEVSAVEMKPERGFFDYIFNPW
mmetsp:Transcript_18262/g.22384  ORF Transcript_18262/g.22384 Transcript_18262/m.22384 type:complete len:318 (+) Transcript_18262:87-1040(+)